MISLISATDLDFWAQKEPRKAQEILPQLLIRLIFSTTQNIDYFNFPIEKGIQFSGYDGVLVSGEKTAFFPVRKSVWEFGTNEDALGKFNSDIQKRSENPLGIDVTDTVFIFATMKIWNHKISIEELINSKKKIYNWKDIQIIDASKLSLWLGQSPSVARWINEIMGTHINGLISLDQYWLDHCHTTTPTLTKEFF